MSMYQFNPTAFKSDITFRFGSIVHARQAAIEAGYDVGIITLQTWTSGAYQPSNVPLLLWLADRCNVGIRRWYRTKRPD